MSDKLKTMCEELGHPANQGREETTMAKPMQEDLIEGRPEREAQQYALRILRRAKTQVFDAEIQKRFRLKWFDPVLGEDVPVADILSHAVLFVLGLRSR